MKDDFHNSLPIVMFRGTPCMIRYLSQHICYTEFLAFEDTTLLVLL